MCGQDKHFGNLHMGRRTGCIEGHIGNVVASERFDAFIYIVGTLCIAMETNHTEIGFHQSRLHVGDTHGRVGHINAQTIADGLDCGLGGAINVATGIGGITGHGTDVDDMTAVALNHAGNNEACHGEQTLDVGINHDVPILVAAFIFLVQS